jgi:hypothetical protein
MLAEATERGFVALALSPSWLSCTSHPPASRAAILLPSVPSPLPPPFPSFWPSLLLVAAKRTLLISPSIVFSFPTSPLHDVRYVAASAIFTVPLLRSRHHPRPTTPSLNPITYHSVVSSQHKCLLTNPGTNYLPIILFLGEPISGLIR